MRIAVLAEGPGELVGVRAAYANPGDTLTEDQLGAAHRLVRTILRARRGELAARAAFVEPRRNGTVRARGTMLHGVRLLERLTTWPKPGERPALQIVLVDEDADDRRLALLRLPDDLGKPDLVVGVAVREFESWLIADPRAVSAASGAVFQQPKSPESQRRREAKELLESHLAAHGEAERRAIRCRIADTFDPATVAKTCPAFGKFADALTAAAARV